MHVLRWPSLLGLAVALTLASVSQAQRPSPHVGYVYPAGGRQGVSLEVTVGGQYLDNVDHAMISGAGISAKVIGHYKAMTPQEATKLRDRAEQLRKKDLTTEAIKELMEIRKKLAAFVRRPTNPAIAENVTLAITLTADAQPGQRELRLSSPSGLTNPLMFCVGQLPEFSQKPATKHDEPLGEKPVPVRNEPRQPLPDPLRDITLPAVVNGQILPGSVDRYRFQARKGQRLVVAASARELIPYLPDAVPGWFQAALTLYDAEGKELAYADHYRFHPDPVLYCEIPADGEYVVEIRDAHLSRARGFRLSHHHGRIALCDEHLPAGRPGRHANHRRGPGLEPARGQADAGCREQAAGNLSAFRAQGRADLQPRAVRGGHAAGMPGAGAQQPAGERPAGHAACDRQRADRPAGRLGRVPLRGPRGRPDRRRSLCPPAGLPAGFRAQTDRRRRPATGVQRRSRGQGRGPEHAPRRFLAPATLPADGTYYLHLGDTQHKGGPEYAYRLRISPPRPDFALRVVPSSVNVRAGANVPLTVYALRQGRVFRRDRAGLEGRAGGIHVQRRPGAGRPGPGAAHALGPAAPPEEPVNLHLEGRATIEGREVVRPAVPAEDMMQAFAYRHLVPAQELKVADMGPLDCQGRGERSGADPGEDSCRRDGPGSTAQCPMRVFLERIALELDDPPDGIRIRKVSAVSDGVEILLSSDAAKAKAGLKGNLIVNAFFLPRPQAGAKAKPQAGGQRTLIGPLPAIPFEVVGK